MANLIMIMGKTKSGKSRSIKNLDPSKTYIINVLDKDLPFKKGRTDFSRENKNIKAILPEKDSWKNVLTLLDNIVIQKPDVTTIIIDDFRHIMENEFVERATEVGYTRFTQIGQHIAQIFYKIRSLGTKDLDVFVMFHTDDVMNGASIATYKAKLVGKLVEEHFDPMELVTICLVTNVNVGKDNKTTYHFVTNKTSIDGIIIPAGSPEEMFPELLIENDLQLVKQAIQKYYKED